MRRAASVNAADARGAGEPALGRAAEHRVAWGVRIFRTQPRTARQLGID